MKYIIIFLSVTICLSFTTSNSTKIKSARVIYKVGFYEKKETKVSEDKFDDAATRKMVVSHIDAMKKAMEDVEYELLFDKTNSLYTAIDKVGNEDMAYKMAKMLFGGDNLYYKNLETKEKIQQVNNEGQLLNITPDFNQYEWTITNETKKIGNYTCYKATTEFTEENKLKGVTNTVTPVVWFTPEIPVPFGPKGFDGLPGLVLEASTGGNIYAYASSIDLNYKSKKQKIEIEKGGKEITKEKYLDLIYEQTKSRTN